MGERRLSRAEVEALADTVTGLVHQGLDVVTAYTQARIAAAPPDRALARIEREEALATTKAAQAVHRHEARIQRRTRRSVTLTAASVATGVLGIITWIPTQAGGAYALLAASAISGVLAVRARWDARHATPPPAPARPRGLAIDMARLPREAIGWSDASQLVAVRRQIVAIVPAITGLHPQAGKEISAAEGEAAPVLTGLVTRLVLLDQVRRDLPGTSAAEAASVSATEVAARLAKGVTHYESLLAAATIMLAAPDISRSTEDVLAPAADVLTAYAHGLRIAAQI